MSNPKTLAEKLTFLYGEEEGKKIAKKLQRIIAKAKEKVDEGNRSAWDEKDIALITFPNAFQQNGIKTLKILNKFISTYLKDSFKIIHILPFYPFSADRGFSVIDYYKVKKEFGNWDDIKSFAGKYRLMTDLVSNHVSTKNKWFQEFLKGNPKYEKYFISFKENNLPPDEQIKMVRRGRATPLLNPFKTKNGIRYLWCTYSIGNLIDQIDLNYHNPEVLLETIKIFIFYLSQKVSILRFDGIGGLWKELGTSCKHLPQNHAIISILRGITKEIGSKVLIFSETTTASFEENYSYMNEDEAHVAYNFALAPHVLLSYYTGSAEKLSEFVRRLDSVNPGNTFFNVLDIHDGLNMYAAGKILDKEEKEIVIEGVRKRGSAFSYRNLPDGSKEVKEMNITWWSALNQNGEEPFELQLTKFITSRAIAMAIKGIPAVYYLSLFGAVNDTDAYAKSQHPRDMNETKFAFPEIAEKLANEKSKEFTVLDAVLKLISKRKSIKAFHPNAKQQILNLDKRIFAVLRGSGKNQVLALHNVSDQKAEVKFGGKNYILEPYSYSWNRV